MFTGSLRGLSVLWECLLCVDHVLVPSTAGTCGVLHSRAGCCSVHNRLRIASALGAAAVAAGVCSMILLLHAILHAEKYRVQRRTSVLVETISLPVTIIPAAVL